MVESGQRVDIAIPQRRQTVAVEGCGDFRGPPGVTFTPHVDADGWLTWTNDGGLENPAPVCVMGPEGRAPEESVISIAEIDAMFEEV